MNSKITWVVALVLVFVSITGKVQNVDKEIEAVTAAEDWRALVDAGKYGDSWKAASGYFTSERCYDQGGRKKFAENYDHVAYDGLFKGSIRTGYRECEADLQGPGQNRLKIG